MATFGECMVALDQEEGRTYSRIFCVSTYEYAYDMIVHCVYAFIEINVEFGQASQSVANSLPCFNFIWTASSAIGKDVRAY